MSIGFRMNGHPNYSVEVSKAINGINVAFTVYQRGGKLAPVVLNAGLEFVVDTFISDMKKLEVDNGENIPLPLQGILNHLQPQLKGVNEGYTLLDGLCRYYPTFDPLKFLGIEAPEYVAKKVQKIEDLLANESLSEKSIRAIQFHLKELVAIGNKKKYNFDTSPTVSVLFEKFMYKYAMQHSSYKHFAK